MIRSMFHLGSFQSFRNPRIFVNLTFPIILPGGAKRFERHLLSEYINNDILQYLIE